MKKKVSLVLGYIGLVSMLLTGCGSASTSNSAYTGEYVNNSGVGVDSAVLDKGSGDSEDGAYADDYSVDMTDNSDVEQESSKESTEESAVGEDNEINRDMLVYYGTVKICAKDFQKSYDELLLIIDELGGFVEYDDLYNQNGSAYNYDTYDEEDTRWRYTATVRVPSTKYDEFMNKSGDIGKVVSKSSRTDNVSQEYSDTENALAIYEAEEERYLERLKTVEDDAVAVQLETALTDLQVQIAQLKSRRSKLETDVAYSYIDVELEEVYRDSKVRTYSDTFWGRLLETLDKSVEEFGEFLESILFWGIINLPKLLVLGLIGVIIIKLFKKIFGKRFKRHSKIKKGELLARSKAIKEIDNIENSEN